jgi:hypothetical protein
MPSQSYNNRRRRATADDKPKPLYPPKVHVDHDPDAACYHWSVHARLDANTVINVYGDCVRKRSAAAHARYWRSALAEIAALRPSALVSGP